MKEKLIIDSDHCFYFKNYLHGLKCMAFPNRIPEEVLNGDSVHSKPLPGQDNDIVFEVFRDDSALINFKP